MPLFWRKKEVHPIVVTGQVEIATLQVEEMIRWKVAQKRQIQALQAELDAMQPAYNQAVEQMHALRALAAVGLEGIVVSPGPIVLSMEGQKLE